MGLFVRLWAIMSIFIVLCPLRGAYRCNIGIYSRYGGILYPVPPPILKRENLGCLLKKFFLKNIFFIFAQYVPIHSSASESRFVFCWLFCCKMGLFSMFFLIAELGLIQDCSFLAIFRAF